MNLAIFLSSGDSFEDMAKAGQEGRFKKFYLEFYSKRYEKIYVFSYKNEMPVGLPKNVFVIPNKLLLNKYLYGVVMPILNFKVIKECNVIRVFHLYGCLPAVISKLLFNKKFVFNYAFDYEKDAKISGKNLQGFIYKILTPLFLNLASKIIAASNAIYTSLPPDKTVYIPNGVDTNVFKHTAGGKPLKPVILSIGRLEAVKNYSSLIQGLKGIDCKVIIIGNGSLKQSLLIQAKNNKIDLEIIEKIENTKLPEIYNQATLFILCSLNEGHPKVLLEAMACGRCCLGTNVPGIKELIKDKETGLLANTDADSLRQIIVYALSNPKLRLTLGKNAREFIKNNYELSVLLNREVNVLNSL